MAESPAQDKTEKPTHERIQKARDDGDIPQSKELPSAMMLIMLLVVLGLTATGLGGFFISQVRQGCLLTGWQTGNVGAYEELFRNKVSASLNAVLPFLIVGAGTSVFACLLVGGWAYSPKAVKLKPARINPLTGLKNLLSLKSLVNLLVSLLKFAVMVVVIWQYLSGSIQTCLDLRWQTPPAILAGIARLVFGLVVRITIGIAAIAAIDWLYQKWSYKRKLRMTKQEIKQEQKDREIPQQVKGRIRTVQFELVRRRMLQEVPTADVVLTNPTHVAVALRYDTDNMAAPTVVAKGPDLLGEKIKEIARSHNVPIVQRPRLARAIYGTVDIGQAIPEALFVAVAEVLAMIYRVRKQRSAQPGASIT